MPRIELRLTYIGARLTVSIEQHHLTLPFAVVQHLCVRYEGRYNVRTI